MTTVMDRVFGAFDDADPSAGGGGNPYINGHSVNTVEIKAVKVTESKQSSKIFFIVEFVVRKTNRDDINVGDIVYGWTHDLSNMHFGLQNCKQFIAAAAGLDKDSDAAKAIGREDLNAAVGEDQILTGTMVTLTTKVKMTKEANKEFTIHEWSPHVAADEVNGPGDDIPY